MTATQSSYEQLFRRLGFGASQSEISSAMSIGYQATVNKTVQTALNSPSNFFAPQPGPLTSFEELHATLRSRNFTNIKALTKKIHGEELPAAISWWLNQMAKSQTPLVEKMTLIWHGHFATAINKVGLTSLMLNQNNTLRQNGLGSMEKLATSVAQVPAMMIWLDTYLSKATHPNENFGRELMERFLIGVGNYSQNDVVAASRAFTGWGFNPTTLAFVLNNKQHDNGSKTFLGNTGNLNGTDIISIILSKPQAAQFLASRLFSFLAYPIKPRDPIAIRLASTFNPSTGSIAPLVASIATSPEFISPQAASGLAKQPSEYLGGIMRALKVNISTAHSNILMEILNLLGQVPFNPPNVGGWPQNAYWLSTVTASTRAKVANMMVTAGDISPVSDLKPSERVDGTCSFLGISDASQSTKQALAALVKKP
ncbi:DUF1800 domain-containing protein [Acidithrix ferrooxidans]|uniref:DUF1800 domain-containing protein n=3 Tax=root TaxID=1 RepID=A0A0D8HLH4_9ACTN|nr:DUF1800 domain-containing protein [Acidithrix ferrooxidans]KJF18845.1 hypothetical protein AXFE_02500 [Acidithrix ferrooxidans]